MRFHLGFSINVKKLLKFLMPLLVGLLAYFGLANITALADTEPGVGIGYYTIDSTTDTQCNIFVGDFEQDYNFSNLSVKYLFSLYKS